jgi:hypothetical protein
VTVELARSETQEIATADDYRIEVQRVVNRALAIKSCMRAVMIPKVHYGVIPGTEKRDKEGNDVSKPCLFQPGADVLMQLFRLRARYSHKMVEREDFISVRTRCRIIHIPTGQEWAEAFGAANSREDRYRNQSTQRTCPKCKAPAIYKSKPREGEDPATKGWFCWAKYGGCGSEFPKNDPGISGAGENVSGDKVWNLANTILKISIKRAKVAAVLAALAATDAFDQDLDDLTDVSAGIGEAINGKHAGDAASTSAGAAAATPKTNGNGNGSNGTPKRVSPGQVRDLNAILRDRGVSIEKTLPWINAMLTSWGKTPAEGITDLAPDLADRLIMAGKNGEGIE